MGPIEGLDKAVAQLEKQAFDQSEGNRVRSIPRMNVLNHRDATICHREWGLMDSAWDAYTRVKMLVLPDSTYVSIGHC